MAEIWLTSDTHLGHERVAEIRGFESSEEHDAFLARRWDKRVQDGDEVWVLGDIAMNGWPERLKWFLERKGRRKHLVLGNHDRPHPMNSRAWEYQAPFLEVFDSVQTSARIAGGYLLSHFPYQGEGVTRAPGKKDRATQWRLRDEGVPLIHGHVHDYLRYRESEKGTPMYHVGVDAWDFAPVTLHDATKEK